MGRYAFVEVLGEGGMGAVYRVQDLKLGRDVALKVLKDSSGLTSVERFQREARALAQLRDPRIIQVYDNGVMPDGRPYLVTEFIEGRALNQILKPGPMNPDEARVLFRELALALAHAHERDVIHRDLKPHNIMIRADGAPVLLDFGLARLEQGRDDPRLTVQGSAMGTPAYMSPEQGNGEDSDERTDVYGFGAALYHALTGRAPFVGDNRFSIMKSVFVDAPEDPRSLASEVPPELARLCLSCLAKEPAERPASMAAVAEALAPPIAAAKPARGLVAALVLTALGLGGVFGALAWRSRAPVRLELSGGDAKTRVLEGDAVLGSFGADGRFALERRRGAVELTFEREGSRVQGQVMVGEAPVSMDLSARLRVEGPSGWTATLLGADGGPSELVDRALPLEASPLMGAYSLVVKGADPLNGAAQKRRLQLEAGASSRVVVTPGLRFSLKNKVWARPLCVDIDEDGRDDLVLTMNLGSGPGQGRAVGLSSLDGREIWRREAIMGYYRRPMLAADGSLVFAEHSAGGEAQTAWVDPKSGEDRRVLKRQGFLPRNRSLWVGPIPVAELRSGSERLLVAVAMEGGKKTLDIVTLDSRGEPRFRAHHEDWDHKFIPPLMVDLMGDGVADDLLLLRPGRSAELLVYRSLTEGGARKAPSDVVALGGRVAASLGSLELSADGRLLAVAVTRGEDRLARVFDLTTLKPLWSLSLPRTQRRVFCWIPQAPGPALAVLCGRNLQRGGGSSGWLGFYQGGVLQAEVKPAENGIMLAVYRRSGVEPLLLVSREIDRSRSRLVLRDPEDGLRELWRSAEMEGVARIDCVDLDRDGRDEVLVWSAERYLVVGEPVFPE